MTIHKSTRPQLRFATLTVVFVTILSVPNVVLAQGLQWMHLLSPGVGWVASSGQVFWTSDNGQHWTDITPPRPVAGEGVASVFFLNASTGWVLMAKYDAPVPRYDLAFTGNSGATWSMAELKIPIPPHEYIFLAQGDVQFSDATHGWMNLDVESSSNFHMAVLFRTADGGKTWMWTPGPGTTGDIWFIDERTGWIASPADGRLWVTRDGARTWSQVSLDPPPQVPAANVPNYQLPVFSDGQHGALLANFDPTRQGAKTQIVLFTTTDAGKSWKFDGVLSQTPENTVDMVAAATDHVVVTAQGIQNTIAVKQIPLGAKGIATAVAAKVDGLGVVMALSFATKQQGWILISTGACSPDYLPCTRLRSTVNAGAAWSDITP